MALRICFFAIICVVVSSIIKHLRPDFLPYLRIGMTVLVGVFAMTVIAPIVTYLSSLFSESGFGEWGEAVFKALGIAVIVQICADICRDCGEGGAATGVELVGKLEIIIACLPMIKRIISTALEVLQW